MPPRKRYNREGTDDNGAIKEVRRSSSRKEIIKNWTEQLDSLVEALGNDSAIYKWLHMTNAGYIKTRLDHTSLVSAIISLAVGTGGLFSTAIQITEKYPVLSMVLTALISILAFIAGSLTLIQRIYDYPGSIEKHKNAEQKYHWIYFNTQAQLRRPKEDREDGNDYYNWITGKYYDASNIEDVSDEVIEKYYKEFPDGTVPGIDGIRKIIIRDEESSLEEVYQQDKDSPKGSSPTLKNSPKAGQSNIDLVYDPTSMSVKLPDASLAADPPLKGDEIKGARRRASAEATNEPVRMNMIRRTGSGDSPTKEDIKYFRESIQNRRMMYQPALEAAKIPKDRLEFEQMRQANLV